MKASEVEPIYHLMSPPVKSGKVIVMLDEIGDARLAELREFIQQGQPVLMTAAQPRNSEDQTGGVE